MSYSLFWRMPSSLFLQKQTPIAVPAGQVISNAASLRFTGKGATNYGKIQQENQLRLLENFAGDAPPDFPTVGQTWFDTSVSTLKVCVATAPSALTWRGMNSRQITNIGEPAPLNPKLGDMWYSRIGSASGLLYLFTGVGRYPDTGSVIGGWDQVFPTIEHATGRDEYDYVYSLVMKLIGDSALFGGSSAQGSAVQYLTNFTTLDASLLSAWNSTLPLDKNVLSDGANSALLKVEPNSNDWDTLLAAAKYALSRLELPPGFATDISPQPFVQDGRQASALLFPVKVTNQYPPDLARQSSRKAGSITLGRYYQETVNVLNAAVTNRYMLKGMIGASGTNAVFGNGVLVNQLGPVFSYSGQFNTRSTVTCMFQFKFAVNDDARFFTAGQALELVLSHPNSGPGGPDTDLAAITTPRGRFRITMDSLLVMDSSAIPALSDAPVNGKGFAFILAGPSTVTLRTITNGTASVVLRSIAGLNAAGNYRFVTFYLDITSTGVTTAPTTVTANFIGDGETYLNPTAMPVYSAPLPFVTTDQVWPF